jgi:hypothetical protein
MMRSKIQYSGLDAMPLHRECWWQQ